MIGTSSENFEETKEFNCTAFLGHGLRWPLSEYHAESVTSSHLALDDYCGFDTRQHLLKENPEEFLGEHAEEFLEEQYYPEEYKNLLQFIDTIEGPIAPPQPTGNKREQILKISLDADQALDKEVFPTASSPCIEYHPYQSPASEELAMEIAAEALETPVMSRSGFQSLVEEHLVGFGEAEKKPNDGCRKRRLCRHFVKGYCLRGVACDFLHDPSIFCSDTQKVFLGGLPLHLTPSSLKAKLEEQGLTVLNKPRILRGFTPQVCLGTVEQAEMLIAQRYIYIDEQRVDVRPYQDRDHLRQVLPRVVKRSVFLGGLPENTTGNMIIKDLQRLDVKVVEYPVVKNGYAPRVVLGSLEHAKMLVDLKRVMVNSTVVDVRPFVNFRKRY
jgi:hypothetical protein